MTEQLPSPEEREQGPEYEADKLVELNEMTQEINRISNAKRALTNVSYASLDEATQLMPSDATLDCVQELALAMTRRQGVEFGKLLVRQPHFTS